MGLSRFLGNLVDRLGNNFTVRGWQDSADSSVAWGAALEVSAQPVSASNPVPTQPAGTIGTDRSANAPSGPGTASSFAWNGTTLSLIATIAANPARKNIEVNNTTGALAVLVIDDGNNTAGTVSTLPLAAGSGAYQQGADWISQTEQGRIRVFGTSGTFVYAREN